MDSITTSPTTSQQIYAQIIAGCEPYVCDAPWDRYQDRGAYTGVQDPQSMLAGLLSRFSPEDLVAAKVVSAGTSAAGSTGDSAGSPDELQLKAVLIAPASILVALRREHDQAPYDLLCAEGSLSGRTPVVAALDDVLADRQDDDEEEDDPTMHAVPSMSDVVALRSLGLCAAPQVGLAELSQVPLENFFRKFAPSEYDEGGEEDAAVDGSADGEVDAQHPYGMPYFQREKDQREQDWDLYLHVASLTALGAEIASDSDDELRSEIDLEPVRSHFEKINRFLGKPSHFVFACRTDTASTDALHFALQHGSRQDFRSTLEHVFRRGATPLNPRPPVNASNGLDTPTNLATAAGAAGAWRQRSDATVRHRERQNLRETLERNVVEPLRKDALDDHDPVSRSLKLTLASQTALLHAQQSVLLEKLAAQSDLVGVGVLEGLNPDDICSISRLAHDFLAITKEIRTCRPSPRVLAATLARPTHLSPSNLELQPPPRSPG